MSPPLSFGLSLAGSNQKTPNQFPKPARLTRHIAAGSDWEAFLAPPPYFLLNASRSRRKSSASFTNRQSGMPNPSATEWATFTLGLRSALSMKEIILEARSARSASSSWVIFFAFRCWRTASAKNLAKFFDNTLALCQPQKRELQEQVFQLVSVDTERPIR